MYFIKFPLFSFNLRSFCLIYFSLFPPLWPWCIMHHALHVLIVYIHTKIHADTGADGQEGIWAMPGEPVGLNKKTMIFMCKTVNFGIFFTNFARAGPVSWEKKRWFWLVMWFLPIQMRNLWWMSKKKVIENCLGRFWNPDRPCAYTTYRHYAYLQKETYWLRSSFRHHWVPFHSHLWLEVICRGSHCVAFWLHQDHVPKPPKNNIFWQYINPSPFSLSKKTWFGRSTLQQ